MIDSTAKIHPSAKISEDAVIGAWSMVGANSVIESGTQIGSHVVIGENTHIGKNNKIYPYASIGSDPQHLGYAGEPTHLNIGDDNVFREFTTVNRGTVDGHGVTHIGNKNYLMAYTHVAHDCIVGNNVIFANTASIAGHVRVDDHVILGAFSGVHQYCRIGAYSFLGRATKIYQDILPFMLVTGNPGIPTGLNAVGLRRHGFNAVALRALKQAFNLLHRGDRKLEEIRAELEKLAADVSEVSLILEIINNSSRGFARPVHSKGQAEQTVEA